MIKESNYDEDTATVNIYAFNIGMHKYIKQSLIITKASKRNPVIVENFSIPFEIVQTEQQ